MEGEGVVLGLVVIHCCIIVLFCIILLAVSSSCSPVDMSSLLCCFCMGCLSFYSKRLQVVAVFVHGGGCVCVGVRLHYFGVLLIVWVVILVCGWSFSLYGSLWQPAVVGCHWCWASHRWLLWQLLSCGRCPVSLFGHLLVC